MSKIYTSADQLIGKTPLLELAHIEKENGLKAIMPVIKKNAAVRAELQKRL